MLFSTLLLEEARIVRFDTTLRKQAASRLVSWLRLRGLRAVVGSPGAVIVVEVV
jgi:hypothetical protein